MPTKPTSRPNGRHRYIVRNWSACDRALRRRGDVTFWISEEAVAAWLKSDKRTAGGDPVYADLAIETVLMVRTVFHLPLRQAEGFVAAVFGLMGIDLPVPDHTTLSRRGPALRLNLPAVPATGPVEILVDSTGLRVVEVKSGRRRHDPKTERVRALLMVEPDLAELRRRLADQGIATSPAAISRFLSAQGLTRKKKTQHAAEQERPDVAAARLAWRMRQPALRPERLVFGAHVAIGR